MGHVERRIRYRLIPLLSQGIWVRRPVWAPRSSDLPVTAGPARGERYNLDGMQHRHLIHSEWTLAAVDDAIARGRLDEWKELRDAAAGQEPVRDRILRVCAPRLADPTEQRYYFWDYYVRRHLA